MKTISYAPFFAFVLLGSSPQALSEDVSAAAPIEEIDVVTIIGHRHDAADVPGSAHVVGSEELEAFGQSDIQRVLSTVPGVYVQEEDGFGLRPNIGIRGSGLDRSARIALLEDGILIAPAPYAAPSAYYFPTQRRMNALEVLKGPAAVAVGPRTTGGAINMISTPIPDTRGGKVDLRWGDHNTRDAHINFGDRNDRISWLLETVQSSSDGFKHIDGPLGGTTGFDLDDYVAKLQLDSEPASPVYHSLRIKVGYTDQESDETYLGLTDSDFALQPHRRYAASHGDLFVSEHKQYQLSYLLDPDSNWRASITAYRNEFARNWYKLRAVNGTSIGNVLDDPGTYADEFAVLTGSTSPDDAITKRANNREYFSEGIQARVEWDVGIGDFDVGVTGGFRFHSDEEDRFQHEDRYRMDNGALALTRAGLPGSTTNRVATADVKSLFIDAEVRGGNWIVTPGVRFEDISMRRLDFATTDPTRDDGATRVRQNSTSVAIPGIGALYRLGDNWRLLAGIHKGFNPPAPGTSAGEETSLNVEAGLRFSSDNFSLDSIGFISDFDNLVGTVTESTGGGEIGDQFDGGKVIVTGLELSTAYEWTFGRFQMPLNVDYTWTAKAEFRSAFDSGFDPWGTVESGDELPYIPEHQLRVTGGLRTDDLRIDLAANYVGKMRTRAAQGALLQSESIDSRLVWDIVASWKFSERFASYIKVDNVLDKTYIAARRPAGARPGLPRSAYLGITYRL